MSPRAAFLWLKATILGSLLASAIGGCSMLPDGAWLIDQDGDGYPFDVDCDDGSAEVYPGAPSIDGDGLVNDCDLLTQEWEDAIHEMEQSNDQPPEPVLLADGATLLLYGEFSSLGWDPDATRDDEVTCDGSTSLTEFPPLSEGNYSGDVDWTSVRAGADGTLCATVEVAHPETVPDFGYDVIPYALDSCLNPLAAYSDDEDLPTGLSLLPGTARWAVTVEADAAVGVDLAGFVPSGVIDAEVPWRLGLALVDDSDACPDLP